MCSIFISWHYITVEVAINVVYGLIWFYWGKRMIQKLQSLPTSDWHVLSSEGKQQEEEEALKVLNEKV